MYIRDFDSIISKKLEKFMDQYKANHESDPENWPLEMNFAEWVEQFIIWNV